MSLNNLDKNGDYLPHNPAAGGAGAAIASAVTGGTAGSVLYVGPTGLLAQDNANFSYDDVDHQLVMGAGSVGKPSIIFVDDTTGFYRVSANVVGFAISGVLAAALGGTGPVTDQTFTFGNLTMDGRQTGEIAISHRSMTTNGQQALRQNSTGATRLNSASGQTVTLSIGNSGFWAVDGSSIAFGPTTDNARDIGATAVRLRRLMMAEYWEGSEMTAPAAPGVDKGRLFFQDNGGGKTQLMVIFNTGAAQQVAIQP